MNITIRITSFLLLILLNISCSEPKSENINSDEAAIIDMLNTFYKSYIIENSKDSFDNTKIESIITKHCTKTFLEKINKEELDADPFINGQDFNKEWANTLSFSKIKDKNLLYKACFIVTYDNSLHCVNVSVINENNIWKIDNVK